MCLLLVTASANSVWLPSIEQIQANTAMLRYRIQEHHCLKIPKNITGSNKSTTSDLIYNFNQSHCFFLSEFKIIRTPQHNFSGRWKKSYLMRTLCMAFCCKIQCSEGRMEADVPTIEFADSPKYGIVMPFGATWTKNILEMITKIPLSHKYPKTKQSFTEY